MKTVNLLLSGLCITEDEYHYKGSFTLGDGTKTMNIDMEDLESAAKLSEIKAFFMLEENTQEIRNILIDLAVEKAAISSKYIEGHNYNENLRRKKTESVARSLDKA